jgi:UDP-N-acetylmuramate dehydrogenase
MRVVHDLDLSPYNSYGLRSSCARAFFPETEQEVREVYVRHGTEGKILLGSGHNVILARDRYDEDFVIFNGNFDRVRVEDMRMEAQAGAYSAVMSEAAASRGLSGLEMFFDIPSSLGGAVVMNAGASGEEIGDLIETVRFLDLATLEIHEIVADEAEFSYRHSRFQADPNLVVLGARLCLVPADAATVWSRMTAIRDARWAKQPRDLPNAGSVFKRPDGRYVGPMVEELGLKGFGVGGVGVSRKHAGFIVRHGPATGADLLALIEEIRERVRAAFGVDLEVEQRIVR